MKKSAILLIILLFSITLLYAQVNTTDVQITNGGTTPPTNNEANASVFINPLDNQKILNANNMIPISGGFPSIVAYTSANASQSWVSRYNYTNSTDFPAVVIDRNGNYFVLSVDG